MNAENNIPQQGVSAPYQQPAPPQKKNRTALYACGGCGGCGCISIILILIFFGYIGSYFTSSFVNTKPLPPSANAVSEESRTSMKSQLQMARENFEAGEQVTVAFSEDEFNAFGETLMENDPTLKVLDADIDGDNIHLRFSQSASPEDNVFFNMEFKGQIDYRNNSLDIKVDDLKLGGNDWGQYFDGSGEFSRNFLKGMTETPLEDLRKQHGINLQSLYVEDGKIHMEVRKE